MKSILSIWNCFVLLAGVVAAAPPDVADRYYEAIRNNDLTTLRELLRRPTSKPSTSEELRR